MEKIEKIRFFDDSELIEYKTNLEGWVGQDNLYYGKGEEGEKRARYANSTHKKCDCGEIYPKNSFCKICSNKKLRESFLKLEEVEWDGESMMCVRNDEKFFCDMEEVLEYCEDNDIEIGDLELMHCEKKVNISEINIDELNEKYITNDGNGVSHYHPEIADKVDELNELIRKIEPKLWFQTNKRIKFHKNDKN